MKKHDHYGVHVLRETIRLPASRPQLDRTAATKVRDVAVVIHGDRYMHDTLNALPSVIVRRAGVAIACALGSLAKVGSVPSSIADTHALEKLRELTTQLDSARKAAAQTTRATQTRLRTPFSPSAAADKKNRDASAVTPRSRRSHRPL